MGPYSQDGAISASHIIRHQYTALQNRKTLSAYFSSKQILPFGFARRDSGIVEHNINAVLEIRILRTWLLTNP